MTGLGSARQLDVEFLLPLPPRTPVSNNTSLYQNIGITRTTAFVPCDHTDVVHAGVEWPRDNYMLGVLLWNVPDEW